MFSLLTKMSMMIPTLEHNQVFVFDKVMSTNLDSILKKIILIWKSQNKSLIAVLESVVKKTKSCTAGLCLLDSDKKTSIWIPGTHVLLFEQCQQIDAL